MASSRLSTCAQGGDLIVGQAPCGLSLLWWSPQCLQSPDLSAFGRPIAYVMMFFAVMIEASAWWAKVGMLG